MAGRSGTVTFVLFDPHTGQIIQRSSSLFNPQIQDFIVRPEIDDGVTEPGERIRVSHIRVRNMGGLVLPAGTSISIRALQNFRTLDNEPSIHFLTENIDRDQEVLIPIFLVGMVGPSLAESSFQLCVSLLDRDFPGPKVYSLGLVQQPVFFRPLPQLTGSVGPLVLLLEIENRSNFTYGTSSPHGSVQILVEAEPGLRIIQYTPEVTEILPRQAVAVEITVEIVPNVPYYSELPYSVSLILREQTIQSGRAIAKCLPTFNFENPRSEMLVLVASPISKQFFDAMQAVMTALRLDYRVWDGELYKSLCTFGNGEPAPWVGQYQGKLIVIIANDEAALSSLDQLVLYNHFYGVDQRPCHSSLLFLYGDNPKTLVNHLFADPRLYHANALEEEKFADWYSVSRVSEDHMKKKCQELEKELKTTCPEAVCRVHVEIGRAHV